MQTEEVLTQIDGPKGVAEVVEVTRAGLGSGAPEYQVRFQGQTFRYLTLGEAHIEASTLASVPV